MNECKGTVPAAHKINNLPFIRYGPVTIQHAFKQHLFRLADRGFSFPILRTTRINKMPLQLVQTHVCCDPAREG